MGNKKCCVPSKFDILQPIKSTGLSRSAEFAAFYQVKQLPTLLVGQEPLFQPLEGLVTDISNLFFVSLNRLFTFIISSISNVRVIISVMKHGLHFFKDLCVSLCVLCLVDFQGGHSFNNSECYVIVH